MTWIFVSLIQSAFAGNVVAPVIRPESIQFARATICHSQHSFQQNRKEMIKEIDAKINSSLALEEASSFSALDPKNLKHRWVIGGAFFHSYLLAVAAGDAKRSVDLGIFLQKMCANYSPPPESVNKCILFEDLVTHPQALKEEVQAQIKFLKESTQSTGNTIDVRLDGASDNIEDARGQGGGFGRPEKRDRYYIRNGKKYMRVGYGFWELISTWRFCFYPSGCEYEVGLVEDGSNIRSNQLEYTAVHPEACMARDLKVEPAKAESHLMKLKEGVK